MSRTLKMAAPALLAVLVGFGGCSSDGGGPGLPSLPNLSKLNPFGTTETPLPGKRVSVLAGQEQIGADLEAPSEQITMPGATANVDWSQPGGTASNAPGNLAFEGGLKSVFTADAGTGSSKKMKITAVPIVHQGRIFTLDAASQVSAFSAAGGSRAWSQSLVPASEDEEEGIGGGIAAEGELVFVASGFGVVVALDAGSGAKVWEKKVGAPVRSSPTVAEARVYVVNIEGRVACLSSVDGAEIWSYRGPPQQAGVINNVSPAVADGLVVVPFSSGDLIALKADTGALAWSESLGTARAVSGLSALSDPSRPVIDGGVVYAIGHGGRMIATSQKSGERIWSLSIGGTQAPAVAGDAVYVVDLAGRLVAVTRETGTVRWAVKLPGTSIVWSGPVLAGGRLWLASAGGGLLGVDAMTGKVAASRELDDKILIPPIVAAGRLIVLTDDAQLVAFN